METTTFLCFTIHLNKDEKFIEPISKNRFQLQVYICRGFIALLIFLFYVNSSLCNEIIENFYMKFLKSSKIFTHFAFEPLLASLCFLLNIVWYSIIDYFIPYLHKYRIRKSSDLSSWDNRFRDALSQEILWYLGFWIPYGGYMRARTMPQTAASITVIMKEVFLALVIYDFAFFIGHNILHRSSIL
jgi:hypothetical protein